MAQQVKLGQPVNRRLGDLLVADGLLTAEQLKKALAEQKGSQDKIGSVLIRLSLINEDQLIGFLSRQYGVPSITLAQLDIDSDVLKLVPAPIARKYEVIPVRKMGNSLALAMADPTNVFALDDIAFMTNLQVLPLVASQSAILSRLKIMSNLDIAERRLPQDGRIKLRYNTREIDFRVSTLPTIFGEKAVLRILDKESLKLDLTQLGFDDWSLDKFNAAIHQPYGMVLITGPTGSGKTTTLYSGIHTINSPDVNIMTAEDPVEYNLKGVNQVQINEGVGRTFAAALRSFLRQDPDVILVGETRDLETAQISIRAALTGHLVFSTLHTNDCPSTIARLLDMGIPPFLVASSLLLVLAQRLGRKICKQCREPYDADEESLVPYGHVPSGKGKIQFFKGKGCATCNFTGMKGRVAIYEVMPVSEQLRDGILKNQGTAELRAIAQTEGMKSLRQAGLLKVIEGTTTIEEVLRVTLS